MRSARMGWLQAKCTVVFPGEDGSDAAHAVRARSLTRARNSGLV